MGQIVFESSDPLPMTVLAMMPQVQEGGGA